jgi:hypothetical protein
LFALARFEVMRTGKSKYCVGVVKNVNIVGRTTMLLFHFPKTHVKFDEWIELGSSRICPVNTKSSISHVPKKQNAKQPSRHGVAVDQKNTCQVQSMSTDESNFEPSIDQCIRPVATVNMQSGHMASVCNFNGSVTNVPYKQVASNFLKTYDVQPWREASSHSATVQHFNKSISDFGISGQPASSISDSVVSLTTRDNYQRHSISNNGENIDGQPAVDHCLSSRGDCNQNALHSNFYRQPSLDENKVNLNNCNSVAARQQLQHGLQQTSAVGTYVGLSCKSDGHSFQPFSQYGAPQGMTSSIPVTPGDGVSRKHGIASFDKLLLLASASHGQVQQQINTQTEQMPQLYNSTSGTYQHQETQHSYQHPNPQVDCSWSGWVNPGNM